ncbi:MAG: glycine cleavage system aminomethyltransferase GcvT [Epsilonproteobacteria bacterium]|nr:MAG: glycine cleavage system aminomethyltransferase GcvT [Campylobacterota bacterium]RLA63283.1 MAG: glycine cleavage system aminomethyltransferase GcvT [Campylobacterota bacterium]
MKKTSLHQKHIDLNAKMAPFAGFDMPLQYTSVKEEALAVRNNAGVFDVSHMGEFFVEGKDALKFVDFIITNEFISAPMNKAIYSPLCREDGTVIDDLIAYKLAADRVLICVNASNIEKDFEWISTQASKFDINLTDRSDDYSLLALQGPKSAEILAKIGPLKDSSVPYYSVNESEFMNEKIILARTGYTGEDGFEIFCSHKIADFVWDELMKEGVTPCGLVARDVLRLEVCYPLYGHELNDQLTPLDSGLKWTVKMNKETFLGKGALNDYSPKYRLIKLSLDRGIPREGYPVLDGNENPIGKITSGTMSVTTGKGIALALVEKEKFPADKELFITIRNKNYKANYHTKPFITGGHK